MKLQSVIFVVVVSFIITTITSIYATIYLSLLCKYNPIAFYFTFALFATCFTLMLISYFRAVCSSPGHPNPDQNRSFTSEAIQQFKLVATKHKQMKMRRKNGPRYLADPEELKQMTQASYCVKCDLVKYCRFHHCRLCDYCIERMDHHCPWVGNCVGKRNHKYFILFLLYATLGLAIIWICILIDSSQNWKYISKTSSQVALGLTVAAGIGAFLLFVPIATLLITQLMMAASNITTLESFVPGMDEKKIFDKGSSTANFQQIFGQNCWFIPTEPVFKQEQIYNPLNGEEIGRNHQNAI